VATDAPLISQLISLAGRPGVFAPARERRADPSGLRNVLRDVPGAARRRRSRPSGCSRSGGSLQRRLRADSVLLPRPTKGLAWL